jgi:hypothetical protein
MNRVLYDMFVFPIVGLVTGLLKTLLGLVVGLIAGGGFGVAAYLIGGMFIPAKIIELKFLLVFFATFIPGSIACDRVFRGKRLNYVTVRGRLNSQESKEV